VLAPSVTFSWRKGLESTSDDFETRFRFSSRFSILVVILLACQFLGSNNHLDPKCLSRSTISSLFLSSTETSPSKA
jgi:hypothetical protein